MQSDRLDNIYNAILAGKAPLAAGETESALAEGIAADEILHQACIPAMTEVGRLFEHGEKFVPEMLIAARAMQSAVDLLKPHLMQTGITSSGTVLLGSVAGDLHDIGKNLVGMMMEGAGFEIIDLGTDVSSEQFVAAVKEHQPDILGMSALLTTTIPAISHTINALVEAGIRDRVKIIIGGAPITQDMAAKVGADAYAQDAGSAPRIAKALLEPAA